jgi:4-amino-4-deoxy-L-arabinose transferase-like glycosyltransferase
MLGSWHNFIFNAFDPAGFISIDKPPVAIWLQVASAKLLGFSAPAILLAQVVAGLAAILLVYVLVRKYWGGTAGAIAALSLALSPVNVAVDRSNNTESCLILVLLAGVWLAMRAAETGRLALLCAAVAAIGIGFNVKMGAALVLAPVLALTFSLARPGAPSPGISVDKPSRPVLVAVFAVMGDLLRSHAGQGSALRRQHQAQLHAGACIGA